MNEFVKKHTLRTQIGKNIYIYIYKEGNRWVKTVEEESKPCIALVVMMIQINKPSV
jgi:hypothetical protein